MKEINLLSIINLYENENEDLFKKYLDYFGVEIKETEKNDLLVLVKELEKDKNILIFDHYYFGFTIPQIGKEFDLLRFGENYNINIELKSENVGEEKIKKQLVRNKFYLEFLGNETYYYTFVSNEKKLYFLDKNNNLVLIEFKELAKKLGEQQIKKVENINNLFNPSDYLVSPFNSTEKFLEGKYFLTRQQEEIKNKILKNINEENYIFGVTGGAGTGKTLLIYDIGKKFIIEKFNILIIHSGILNSGHKVLIKNGWNIIGANDIDDEILKDDFGEKYDLIIIDEAQRIYDNQLNFIIKISNKNNISCIFSFDEKQILNDGEGKEFNNLIESKNFFKLTNNIRSNKEIGDFILLFFNKNKPLDDMKHNFSNIEVNYFSSIEYAKNYVNSLGNEYQIINYTPKYKSDASYEIYNFNKNDINSHKVIGQDYEKVIIVITPHFYYDKGKLSYIMANNEKLRYIPEKMLFQNMTRAIKKIRIVIIKNDEILFRCLEILNQKNSLQINL